MKEAFETTIAVLLIVFVSTIVIGAALLVSPVAWLIDRLARLEKY